MFKKMLLGAALCLVPFSVFAAGASSDELSWTPPTHYVDGTTIQPGDITQYVVRWGNASGSYANEARVAGDVTSYVVPRDPPSNETRCFVVTVIAKGLESDYSVEQCKRRPNPPAWGSVK